MIGKTSQSTTRDTCSLATLVTTTQIESPVTGADISADGTLLGLVAKDGAYVFRIDGDVARVSNANPHHTKLENEHIEGCCFVPEGLLVTSERRMIFLFTDQAFRRRCVDQARSILSECS